eukprot:scaffold2052_cov106-Isochrysis_galbana.AAC.5
MVVKRSPCPSLPSFSSALTSPQLCQSIFNQSQSQSTINNQSNKQTNPNPAGSWQRVAEGAVGHDDCGVNGLHVPRENKSGQCRPARRARWQTPPVFDGEPRAWAAQAAVGGRIGRRVSLLTSAPCRCRTQARGSSRARQCCRWQRKSWSAQRAWEAAKAQRTRGHSRSLARWAVRSRVVLSLSERARRHSAPGRQRFESGAPQR